jgi:YggT family protein
MSILGGFTSLYMILISIRIMLTWFGGARYGKPVEFLRRITDPYLDWFRRFRLRAGVLDLSPVLALGVLSLANSVFGTLGRLGYISLGILLAMALSAVWSAAGFIIGFFILILALRFIAYLTNRDVYHSFWQIIDTLSQPVIYRINRIIFRDRPVNYQTEIIASLAALLVLRIGLGFFVRFVIGILSRFPL